MGRMLFGLFLGFAVVAGVALWARTCLPDPNEEDIDWLRREDVIVVQMESFGGDNPLGGPTEIRPPLLTLYGDGTILVGDIQEDCSDIAVACHSLLTSQLPSRQVRDLLRFIEATGFFDFSYEQPQPPVSGAPTTYLFASSKEAQNAVRANALGWEETSGDQWEEFRKVRTIYERLSSVRADILAEAAAYQADEIVLIVREIAPVDLVDEPAPWPILSIDLTLAASNEDSGELAIDSTATADIARAFADSWPGPAFLGVFTQDGRFFNVLYRPLLPYEENFPEFEPPTQ